jgi:2-polyprenyl-6-methoxyphenol hydroxylase-like FAD-dependent oxidoreductase
MRHTDIVIAGGGLAGSTAAAMLGRAGLDVIVVDPHAVYPPDFRCVEDRRTAASYPEKDRACRTLFYGPRHTTVKCGWRASAGWSRNGRATNTAFSTTPSVMVRAEIPAGAEFMCAKVTAVSTSLDRQRVTPLSSGEDISARLVVVANGLNIGLRHMLGMDREILSACHSITIGFDVEPVHRATFDFPALTYYAEHPTDQMAF